MLTACRTLDFHKPHRRPKLYKLERYTQRSLIAVLSWACSAVAFSSGSQFFTQNTLDMGEGFGGGAAIADNAATNYSNPAGLVRIKQTQLLAGPVFYTSSDWFTGTLTTLDTKSFPPAIHTATFDNVYNGGSGVFPDLSFAYPINKQWSVGLSAVLAFASSTMNTAPYLKDTVSSILDAYFDITPDVAYRLNEHWSLGGGPDFMLSSSQDNFFVFNSEISTKFKMHGLNFGYNLGVLYHSDRWRLGVAYRSKIDNRFKGKVSESNQLKNFFPPGPVDALKQLPARWRISLYYMLSARFGLMSTIYYTQWRNAQHVSINSDINNQKINFNMRFLQNTLSVGTGVRWQISAKTLLMAGVMYDPMYNFDLKIPGGVNKGKSLIQSNSSFILTLGILRNFSSTQSVGLTGMYTIPVHINNYMTSFGHSSLIPYPIKDGNTIHSIRAIALVFIKKY